MKPHQLSDVQASLKLCPHCGGAATLKPMANAPMWFQVRCNAFECGGTTWAQMGAQEAADAWNMRAVNG